MDLKITAVNAHRAFLEMKKLREPSEKRWLGIIEHLHGNVPISARKGEQASKPGNTSSQLATVAYRLSKHIQRTFLQAKDYIRYEVRYPVGGEKTVDAISLLVRYWLSVNKFSSLIAKACYYAMASSYMIFRVSPDPYGRRSVVISEKPELAGIVPEPFAYDVGYKFGPGITIENINPFDFWVTTDRALRVCRYRMSPQKFKEYAEFHGASSDEVEELIAKSKASAMSAITAGTEHERVMMDTELYFAGGKPIDVYHFEGNLSDITEDDSLVAASLTCATFEGGSGGEGPPPFVVIEKPRPYPYWDGSGTDYTFGTLNIDSFLAYPRPLFEDYYKIAQHQTQLGNLMTAGVAIRTSTPVEINERIYGDPTQPGNVRRIYPGQTVINPDIGNVPGILPVVFPPMPQEAAQLYFVFERKIDELGVNELTQGLPTAKGRPTATETNIRTSFTQENRVDYIQAIEEIALSPIVKKIIGLAIQFQTDFSKDPIMLQILGTELAEHLDSLTTRQRQEIAQSIEGYNVEVLTGSAKAQANVQMLLSTLGVLFKMPPESFSLATKFDTKIDIGAALKLLFDALPIDTTDLFEQVRKEEQLGVGDQAGSGIARLLQLAEQANIPAPAVGQKKMRQTIREGGRMEQERET